MKTGAWFLAASLLCATSACGANLAGQAVPAAAINALDGRDMSATAARGHWLLITFSDAKSKDAGRAFFRENAARFARVDRLALHNVIVPGGVMLAPKTVILSRIESDAKKLEAEVRGGLNATERAAFDRASIRWHVDFDRHYTALFDAPPHRVTLVLVNPQGRVTDLVDASAPGAVQKLLARMAPRR